MLEEGVASEKRMKPRLYLILQLGMMLAQAVFFFLNDIYLMKSQTRIWDRKSGKEWAFNMFLMGTTCLIIYLELFVFKYLKVAVALPDTFCIQSEDVMKNRNRNLFCINIAGWIMALTIIGIFMGLLLSNQGNIDIVRVTQMVATSILTICMAFAF